MIGATVSASTSPARDSTHSKPGSVFSDQRVDGGNGPEMVVLPDGTFAMGADSEDPVANAAPRHEVSIASFAMGKTEVTVAQFRAFVDATGYRTEAERAAALTLRDPGAATCRVLYADEEPREPVHWRAPNFDQGPRHPVVCVSWNDADAYVKWLAQATGKGYRLPSEAEQEYALRAGVETLYPWGTEIESACATANVADRSIARAFDSSHVITCSDKHVFTAPAGSLEANAFGLHDTAGNALEWSADCVNENYDAAPADGTAWLQGDCDSRLLRGAAWNYAPDFLPAAVRHWATRDYRSNSTGFRVARDL